MLHHGADACVLGREGAVASQGTGTEVGEALGSLFCKDAIPMHDWISCIASYPCGDVPVFAEAP